MRATDHETVSTSGVAIPLADSSLSLRIQPSVLRPDGLFASAHNIAVQVPPPGVNTMRVPQLLFDRTGAVVDTAGWLEPPFPDIREYSVGRIEVGGHTFPLPQTPSSVPIRSTYADGLIVVDRPIAAVGTDPTFTITSLALDGDTLFRRSYRYRPRPYEGPALDTIVGALTRRYVGLTVVEAAGALVAAAVPSPPAHDTAAYERALRDAMRFPPFQPPIQRMRCAQDGTIWLMREEDGAATVRWTILAPDGEPQRQLAISRDVSIMWSSGDTV